MVPPELDPALTSLLEAMLVKDPYERISLAKVKMHDWCCKKHPMTNDDSESPIGGNDNLHTTTLLPYIRTHYYGPDSHDELITEHQLNETRHQAESQYEQEAGAGGAAGGGAGAGGAAKNRRRRKPVSCINVKSLTTCKQS
ncbi:hypothetical protein Pcinc_034287 [Petrolisthes cinctipes]|uniref:Uncharacterized protein n=1 Tax=Petrolisthes cinctipes TaxID=88211 RepID=A0AAE1EQJ7_PETCI|nr:hypothetical protein Pcinc_034287 [Petrolisthes cinctipes]